VWYFIEANTPFRKRHVKCGEEKPTCRRCNDTGRRCEGYASAKTSPDRQLCAGTRVTASHTPIGAISTYCIPFKVPGSQKDRQKLHYFCVQAALDLSGSLSTNSDFWSRIVLQFSHQEPVVLQALIALSSIHLDFVTTEAAEDRSLHQDFVTGDSLVQYNKAIRRLRMYLSATHRPSNMVTLICCALFCCFDSIRGDYKSALSHLRNGLSILRAAEREIPLHASASGIDGMPEDLRRLELMFSRIDLQATLFEEGRVPVLELTSFDERTGVTPIVATDTFSNLDEAHVALDKLRNQAWRLSTSNSSYKYTPADQLPAHVVQEKSLLVSQFKAWSLALDGLWYQQHCTIMQRSELDAFREAATMLKVPHRSSQMLLLSCLPEDPFIFGSVPNKYGREIMSLIESLHLIEPSRRTYSCEMGIMAPLIMLGSMCKDIDVCGKAMMLLASSKRREGLVDGQRIVQAAFRIVRVKERRDELSQWVADAAERMNDSSLDNLPLTLQPSDGNLAPSLHLVAKVARMFNSPLFFTWKITASMARGRQHHSGTVALARPCCIGPWFNSESDSYFGQKSPV
jgi:Fungal specific transcription factor domain